MDKVKSIKHYLKVISVKHLLIFAFLLCSAPILLSQNTTVKKTGRKKIELIFAELEFGVKDPQTGKDLYRYIGNVNIKHNEVIMWCDSAHFWPDKNLVKAFSKIHIEQGDSLDLFGDYLYYDGKIEQANVRDNVELIDKETHLYTDAIDYDVKNKIARYNNRGRITNADNTLTSIVGVYYVSESLFHFKDSVKIVNPDYVMTADTMDYNTETETSFFTGPTEVVGDSLYLYCEKGWYDTKNEVTSIWKNALINNKKQVIRGDSLFFDDSLGYGQAFRNVIIEDTTNHLAITGNYAWYNKINEKFLVTDKAVFIQISSQDSLFLHADTISAITIIDSTLKSHKLMRAYYGCRVFSKDLQAKCDSLSYSFQDSVIRLYNKPVIWSEENQLTADSMAVFTKNQQTERLELYTAAFIVSQVDSIRYNQIKGRSLTGYFINNELNKIVIKGNAESLYYLLDGETIAGKDQSKSATIEATVEKGKIQEITISGTPEGFLDPPDGIITMQIRLPGFQWLDKLRPKQKSDIFIK